MSLIARITTCAAVLVAAVPIATRAGAQGVASSQGYQEPPESIRRILDAPPAATGSVSPDGKWIVIAAREPAVTTIADMAEPTLYLAGRRFHPIASYRVDTVGIRSMRIKPVTGSAAKQVPVPTGGRIAQYSWSPDGHMIAYTTVDRSLGMGIKLFPVSTATEISVSAAGLHGKLGAPSWSNDGKYVALTEATRNGTALWMVNVATHTAKRITPYTINTVTGGCDWLSKAPQLVCLMNVAGRGAPPPDGQTPTGPIVQESYGRAAPVRTIEYLLKNQHDEALFDYYFTNQITIVTPDGASRNVGKPGIHTRADASPDARWLLVRTVHRPYSYQVALNDFPERIEVWSLDGKVARTVTDRPLTDNVSSARDAVAAGIRVVSWRPDVPATVFTVEALDGGDPRKQMDRHDRVSFISAPFTSAPQPFMDLEMRYRGITWMYPDLALVNEGTSRTAKLRTWAVNPSSPASARVLFDRSSEDRYGDPGRFVMVYDATSDRMVPLRAADGHTMYLTGDGASAEGDRPFLDAIDMQNGAKRRIWQNSGDHYEFVASLTDPAARSFVTRRESPTEPPNFFRREVGSDAATKLTELSDPAPAFAGVTGKLITYTRADGVKLSATMYLPAGYTQSQGRLPFFFWAYPREFLSAAAASEVRGSPYEFKRPSLPRDRQLLLLAAGYGVLDGPSMPIVAKNGKEPNDSYVEQLVASAKAAIDAIDSLGVGDRNRVAVGGHSYGAFMTANLLAHSTLFRAGVAESGAYNRTLTPFGFQAEPRTFWQAEDIYSTMSPFYYADKIKTPILLIHGVNDDNDGTFPIQSERMFAAIKGNGGTVRYVQLPLEPHGYTSRESLRHVMWETVTWLDRYVKNPTEKTN
ncbi:MAG TPA: prolyl oligopeptidase family serine peptidase [Gemmatimonadaceae bacterium]|nr:prolyl oligopeptidase family serine peptidase [Gemmatimonadaceae bacterium]